MRWDRRLLLGAIVASGFAWPTAVRAQSKDDVARADALFNAAKALSDAGQYSDACPKFAESQRLAPGLGVTLYLADCYEHIGRTASAWTAFRAAEGLARARSDKRAEVAREHAQALEAKLDRLTIVVAPTVPRTGLAILRDGLPVSNDELGLPVPVDPGDHAVVVTSPGRPDHTYSAHVGPESRNATVRVDSLETVPSPPAVTTPVVAPPTPAPSSSVAPAPAPAPSPADEAPEPGKTQRWLGIGFAGVGVAGVALGTVFGLLAKSTLDQSNSGPCNASDHCSAAGLSDRQDASTKATVSTVSFIAGGILVAGGAALYFTAPHAASGSGLRLAPVPLVGGGAAVVGGRF